ncbi:MAG: carboxypeptidase regulatory-like domain-containing protein [Fibrobacteria bacterium]|nr:carboxypeptidase regulatory-like domain-containing protein [Fibrobacteria bacterium]
MNIPFRSLAACAALAALSSCDRDSKVFDESDLATERSVVAGRVTGLADSGISGVVVTAQAVDDKGRVLPDIPAQTTLSGAEGRYTLELRPGPRWKVSWSSPDYKTSDEGRTFKLGLHQTLNLPDPDRLTYRYGWVSGRTLPGAMVAVEGQDMTSQADASGDFRLECVVPGAVEVVGLVRGKGYWRVPSKVSAESTTTIKAAAQVATWNPTSRLEGFLVNKDGTPQNGVVLSALGGLVSDTTDIQGRFLLQDLPANGRVSVVVDRGLGDKSRLTLPTAPADSTWDLGSLPLGGTGNGPGVRIHSSVVVGDSGDVVAVPLLWDLLDTARKVLGFAWDTTGSGQPSLAVRTWGPRLAALRIGGVHRTLSAWVTIASPRADGGFDTSWSDEARISVLVRPRTRSVDTTARPLFSLDPEQTWDAPLKLGLTSGTTGASIFWSDDSTRWNAWDPEDSIVLHATTTLWTFSRLRGQEDSRIQRTTFQVRPSASAESLQTKIQGTVQLPRSSWYKAWSCPEIDPGATLLLDTGATLEIPSGCDLTIDEEATLELRPRSRLVMGSGASITVGHGTVGQILVKGTATARASIVSKDSANPMGYVDGAAILLKENSGGSRIAGLDLLGARMDGILLYDAEADIVDSRIRSCRGAGIVLEGSSRPSSAAGFSNDSISQCRWSVRASPRALGRIASNPGFSDTLRVDNPAPVTGNATWVAQSLPIRVDVTLHIQNNASLSLAAGVELRMANGTYFEVGYTSAGTLITTGTLAKPVRIVPQLADLGWGWDKGSSEGFGIGFKESSTSSRLEGLVLTGSVANGILVRGSTVGLANLRIDSNALSALRFDQGGRPDSTSQATILASGNRWSIELEPSALGILPTLPGLKDSLHLISGNEVSGIAYWKRQPVPVHVSTGIEVRNNSQLVIEAGSHLVFEPGTYLEVGYGSPGGLVVSGTTLAPVQFSPLYPTTGWGFGPSSVDGFSLKFADATTTAEISHLILDGAAANGIVFESTPPRFGLLDSVEVTQVALPPVNTALLHWYNTTGPQLAGTTSLLTPLID